METLLKLAKEICFMVVLFKYPFKLTGLSQDLVMLGNAFSASGYGEVSMTLHGAHC